MVVRLLFCLDIDDYDDARLLIRTHGPGVSSDFLLAKELFLSI